MSTTPPRATEFLEFAWRTAQAAGAVILPHFRVALDVADKGGAKGYDPVTVADQSAESVISAAIARTYEDHGIRGEEHGWQKAAQLHVGDRSIDGTRSIPGADALGDADRLNDGERPVAGVAHPLRRRSRSGDCRRRRSGGAAAGGRCARRCRSVDDAVVACTDPKMFETAAERAAFDQVADRAPHPLGRRLLCVLPAGDGTDRRRDRGGAQAYDVNAHLSSRRRAASWRPGRENVATKGAASSPVVIGTFIPISFACWLNLRADARTPVV
jgi:hypothetical protein